MENLRRISALLIAISLVLPTRSCVNGGQVEVHYPLSSADTPLTVLVITAFYTVPLLLLLLSRYRAASLLAGIATTGAGLYFISYGATIVATTLLAGWYTYTIGAVLYLLSSLAQWVRLVTRGKAAGQDANENFPRERPEK